MVIVKRIEEVEHASPKCNSCSENSELVLIIEKDSNKAEKIISLCGDCYIDLLKKMTVI